jgi:hypothetical protein
MEVGSDYAGAGNPRRSGALVGLVSRRMRLRIHGHGVIAAKQLRSRDQLLQESNHVLRAY